MLRLLFSDYSFSLILPGLSLHSNHWDGCTVAPPMVIEHMISSLSSGHWQGYTVALYMFIQHLVSSLAINLEEVSN